MWAVWGWGLGLGFGLELGLALVVVAAADPAKFGWLDIIIVCAIRFPFRLFTRGFRGCFLRANEVTQIWIILVALC